MADAVISEKLMLFFCTIISTIISFFTFIMTRWITIIGMEKKYRLKEESTNCMKEREMAESKVFTVLNRLEKRMALGNIIMRKLVEHNDKIPNDEIEKIERDLGIHAGDKNFSVPD